jgi:CHASE2 domain-containing sensor protein
LTVAVPPWWTPNATRWRASLAPVLAIVALSGRGAIDSLDDRLFDSQVQLIRAWRGAQSDDAGDNILIVGIDESTLQRAGVPIALIHGISDRLWMRSRAQARGQLPSIWFFRIARSITCRPVWTRH